MDIRWSRSIGILFVREGGIFRTSIDCSEKMDGRIVVDKVSTPRTSDFNEAAHNIVDPFKDCHYSDMNTRPKPNNGLCKGRWEKKLLI